MRVAFFVVLSCFFALSSPAHAVTVGLVDNFEDGTTEGWVVGLTGGAPHPAPPQNMATGGPDGVDDSFGLLSAFGGAGPGSRLTAINTSQWAGDYLAAGVAGITMDVRNLGSSDLLLRLFLENPIVGPPTDAAFSTDAVFVPAGSGWMTISFAINAAALTVQMGSLDDLLMNVTALRIFHSEGDGFPGEPIVANLGIDNITATASSTVPLPAAAPLFAFGLALLAWRRRAGQALA